MKFHLERQTGGLTRAIDRGTKSVHWPFHSVRANVNRGIAFLLSSIVFHIIPTALEISLVSGILVRRSGLKQTMGLTLPSLTSSGGTLPL